MKKIKKLSGFILISSLGGLVPLAHAADQKTEVSVSGGVSASVTRSGQGGGGAVTAALDKSVAEMEASVKQAIEAFRVANKPREQVVKDFDSFLAALDRALKSVGPGGELDQMIDKLLKEKEESLKLFQTKASNADLKESIRSQYEQNAKLLSGSLTLIRQNRIIIRKKFDDLTLQKVDVTQEKDLYIDSAMAGLVDDASKSLDRVKSAMQKVSDSISGLRDVGKNMDAMNQKAQN